MDIYPLLETVQTPALSLSTWEAYDPSVKVHLTSTALRVGQELFLIDPIPLPEGSDLLHEGARPAAILLTNGNHERSALTFAQQWAIPVYASAAAIAEFTPELRAIARPFPPKSLPLEIIPLPGGAEGETAFYSPEAGGVAVVGDALIHLPTTGFCLLPEKYCGDVALLRDSVGKLASLRPGLISFAHGRPLIGTDADPIAEKIATLPRES